MSRLIRISDESYKILKELSEEYKEPIIRVVDRVLTEYVNNKLTSKQSVNKGCIQDINNDIMKMLRDIMSILEDVRDYVERLKEAAGV